jgi:hypothetical protein
MLEVNEKMKAISPILISSPRGDQTKDRVNINVCYHSKRNDGGTMLTHSESTVGKNLGLAMYHLRRDRPVRLWIDAISINQQDSIEKTHQVQLMHEIYAQSEVTVVFLRQAGIYTNSAINTMKDLRKEFSHFFLRDFPELSIHNPKPDEAPVSASINERATKATRNLCERVSHFLHRKVPQHSIRGLKFRDAISASLQKQPNHQKSERGVFLYDLLAELMLQKGPVDSLGRPMSVFLAHARSAVFDVEEWERQTNFRKGLDEIWASAWWNRVWIYQEYLAPKTVVFMCGDVTMAPEDLWLTVAFIRASYSNVIEKASERRHIPMLPLDAPKQQRTNYLLDFRSERQSWTSEIDLIELMVLANSTTPPSSTDARDLVYAFLGLANKTYGVIPDYMKSIEEVFTNTTMGYLEESADISIIQMCDQSKSTLMIPSWVIDWEIVADMIATGRLGIAHSGAARYQGMSPNLAFKHGDGEHSQRRQIKMHINSVLVGRVDQVSPSMRDQKMSLLDTSTLPSDATWWVPKFAMWKTWLELALHFLRGLPSHQDYPDPLTTIEDILRLITGGLAKGQTGLLDYLNTLLKGDAESCVTSQNLWLWFALIDAKCDKQVLDSSLFSTNTVYVGYRGAVVENGDLLVVFCGTSIPFIIRPVGEDVYRVVGTCIVPRIDHGEFAESNLRVQEYVVL